MDTNPTLNKVTKNWCVLTRRNVSAADSRCLAYIVQFIFYWTSSPFIFRCYILISNIELVLFDILGEFSRAFREWPTYPLNSLLLGVSFLHLSCQKFHQTRHTSILHVGKVFEILSRNFQPYKKLLRAYSVLEILRTNIFVIGNLVFI